MSSPARREDTPHDPDQEALLIARRVLERVAVARSLMRITGQLARAYVDRSMQALVESEADPLAKVAHAKKVARAATAAAKHAARRAAERLAEDDTVTE